MAKNRSITNEEIALIKAMAARGMKNKDIQFFFNRPDRPVNSGRITGIKDGSYSDSSRIGAASDGTLDAFLKSFKATGVTASVAVPGSGPSSVPESGPMVEATLAAMFAKDTGGVWRFKFGESETHECKQDFGFKHTGKWLRAVAALANNSGGYIVFGVKDKKVTGGKVDPESYKVTGLKGADFVNADPADFTKRIKSTFDPTPEVETGVLEIDGLKVGIMFVHQHGSRPVIAQKGDGDQVKEGDIFFRYPGQSARIKYSDLRSILDERDRQSREQILPMVEKLLQLGPRDAMVADLADGILSDENRSIVIGEDLLDKIKFIREGEFDEKKGESTLKLVGEVQAVDGAGAVLRKGFATPADLIRNFLNGTSPYDPKDYVRCAVEVSNGAWLPMHFYGEKAGLDRQGLADFIHTTKAPAKRKETYADRALGKNSPYQKAGGAALDFLAKIKGGDKPEPKTPQVAADVARAITGLEDKPELSLEDLLSLLGDCWEIIETEKAVGWELSGRQLHGWTSCIFQTTETSNLQADSIAMPALRLEPNKSVVRMSALSNDVSEYCGCGEWLLSRPLLQESPRQLDRRGQCVSLVFRGLVAFHRHPLRQPSVQPCLGLFRQARASALVGEHLMELLDLVLLGRFREGGGDVGADDLGHDLVQLIALKPREEGLGRCPDRADIGLGQMSNLLDQRGRPVEGKVCREETGDLLGQNGVASFLRLSTERSEGVARL
ncbi:ATP-binding protein [Aestuariibius sp. 2305UL40-4]|uniref:ATP-binding protein n=1 Tax=Aestuariibius violaceus TaxID=3234132 RepID=UPI00345E25C8